ncbi:MAG: tRNA (guanosine(37)-N1)-methyltransferase TrmD, partial [Candidatus Omnitrophica bacterium]|nr:tRNA (guanosine(37)-N1)-methyltransferase TrmD [Candidatus Omnitrophota bacterium]
MIIDVVTIFPKMFSPVLGESMIKRAQDKGLVKINVHNLRNFAPKPHRKVDAPSYGGGGMVFKPEPLFGAVESILDYKVYPK